MEKRYVSYLTASSPSGWTTSSARHVRPAGAARPRATAAPSAGHSG
nr:MAG TPA: hypothetical protein [Caudoviricetes sp.]